MEEVGIHVNGCTTVDAKVAEGAGRCCYDSLGSVGRSTESPHHQDPYVFHPVILEVVQLFFDLLVKSSSRDVAREWSEGRVGVMALIQARGDLNSSCRI